MKSNIQRSLEKFIAMTLLISTGIAAAVAQDSPTGEFDGHGDIGHPELAGSASYDVTNQAYTISGAGINLWFTNDQCHFVWKKMNGDFILRTRVEFVGQGAAEHRKIGWMVRSSLDADASYADCAEHGSGLTSLQFRRSKGADTEEIKLAITNADVLQFERKGNTYIFSAAHYGEPFVSAQLADLDLGDDVYVGLFVCSHNANVIEKAVFRDVRIIRPAKAGFVPYRDYIGSVLEILDVHGGKLQKIYSSAQPFEAPNWTTDGQALIYNISGRAEGWGHLCRFDLAAQKPSLINTDPANRNNNDHVLSADGTMLGISDQSPDHGGQSRIFTVPVQGGTPRLITPLTPSYLHGWSPDGKFLVFTGGRANQYDIYKIPSDGSGPEMRLTDAKGLNDGPEYTPDGRYIYFNSSRTGKMQIWRMKPDGRDQEQITHDEYNNWFPHISPDGKWIVIISYPPDINPAEHPYYQQCYLRLLPIAGGHPKVIAYVYGGQGTINVPSWSPDSQRIAFVSNTDMEQ
jgi:TolB protein